MKTKVASLALLLTLIFPIMAKSQVKIQQTAGRDALGEFAPEFARLMIFFSGKCGAGTICFRSAIVPS